MKLLITGGAGFIGSALIRHIISHTAHSVINIDKLSYAANLKSLAEVEHDPRYAFVQGDVCNHSFIADTFTKHKPDAVIHLAGESHVDRSIKDPDIFITSNIIGTQVLLECARDYWSRFQLKGFRFLYVSTEEIYGSRTGNESVDENAPYRPNSPYAGSKAAATNMVQTYFSTYALPTLVTCSSNNYGTWQYPEKLIPATINNAIKGLSIPVYGQGQAQRSWLYIDDHIRALLCVLEKGQPGLNYNINGNDEIKNIDLVHLICDQLDQYAPAENGHSYRELIQFVDNRPGHDHRYGLDDHRIRETLGWIPTENFENGLKKTIIWNLEHINLWNKPIN